MAKFSFSIKYREPINFKEKEYSYVLKINSSGNIDPVSLRNTVAQFISDESAEAARGSYEVGQSSHASGCDLFIIQDLFEAAVSMAKQNPGSESITADSNLGLLGASEQKSTKKRIIRLRQ